MYIDNTDFENLVIDGVEPIIKNFDIDELQLLKERNCNTISQFIIEAAVKANDIKNSKVNGDMKSYINYLDMTVRDNKSFNPNTFYDAYKSRDFKPVLLSQLRFNKFTFCLIDIYKYLKQMSCDSNDYYIVKEIFDLLKLCCKNLKIKTPSIEELNSIIDDPSSEKCAIYNINIGESENISYMDTIPFYVNINCDGKKYIANINQPTCFVKTKNNQKNKIKKG